MKSLFSNLRSRLGLLVAVAAAFSLSACSDDGPENLGTLNQPVSSSDTVTRKEVVALSSPTKGQAAVTVKQTTNYLHKRTFKSDQIYTVSKNGTAEFVERLGYWMHKDSDATLYRFNEGSTAGSQVARPSVAIGNLNAPLSSNDRSTVSSVSSGAVENGSRTLNVTSSCTHADTYNDITYTLNSTVRAEFVNLQNAHFAWISGNLYRADANGRVESLREKPTAHVGVRNSNISSNDRFESSSVTAGAVSFSGQSRTLVHSREYINEETYQRLRYSIQENVNATLVSEQSSHMAFIGKDLYSVRLGSNSVARLSSKPVVNLGERSFKLSSFDPQTSIVVTPLRLSTDSKSIIVIVRRNFRHDETFQSKVYHAQTLEVATYNSTYKLWTVIVDGRLYVVAFAGDSVNDPNVEVIHAPSDLQKPDVIVIGTGDGNPPVVVPGKNRNDAPPVVVPGKKRDDAPPVVVPGKKRDDAPPVVVPGKNRNDAPPVVVPGKTRNDANRDDAPPVVVPGKKLNNEPPVTNPGRRNAADEDSDAPPVVVPRR